MLAILLLGVTGAKAQPPATVRLADVAPLEDISLAAETPVDLETALRWTLARNPDLVALRQDRPVSAAAWDVARRFPMSVNPSVSVDVRPWTFDGQTRQSLDTVVSTSWMQPIELGYRRRHRAMIGRAKYSQTDWEIVEAELAAMVQTFRLHQTAVYRREKLHVAKRLDEFNAQLVQTVRRQVEATQLGPADLVLAEVERQATVQRLQTAQQAYVDALTELRKQLGIPDLAKSLIPAGALQLPEGPRPGTEAELICLALERHPAIQVAQTRLAAAGAAVCLARADRIPVPAVGPVYESDETGTTFYGLAVTTPIHVLNTGRAALYQRQAEYRREWIRLEQLRARIKAELQASLGKWNRTKALVDQVAASTDAIQSQNERMERLFAAGQTDLLRLLRARQSLIQAENARLDMMWQTTQAYADLLRATGVVPLDPSHAAPRTE